MLEDICLYLPQTYPAKLHVIRDDITRLHRKISPTSPITRNLLFVKLLLANEEKRGIFSQKTLSINELLTRGVGDAMLVLDEELDGLGRSSKLLQI